MIKIFRNIRQQFLTENKFSKYILYALGEIVLLVIGIIIALQINNWNETRKAFNNETQLYFKLWTDLNSQYKRTEIKISHIKEFQDVHYQIYNETRKSAKYDSTLNYNSILWLFPYLKFISEKYTPYLNSIRNEKIRSSINNYISIEQGTQNAYNEWNDFKVQQLRPFFTKYGMHNTGAVYNDRPYTFNSLMSIDLFNHSALMKRYGTIELDEILYELRFKTSWVFQNLNWLEESNRELQLALKNELRSTNNTAYQEVLGPTRLHELLTEKKTIDAIVEVIKKEYQDNSSYDISENEISNLGHLLMNKERFNDALKIFKLNTELYPTEFNAYDSYGECLLKIGEVQDGVKAYQKSLELNPNNINAEKILSQIKIKHNNG